MKSISIKNYKNLRDLTIDSLSKVNLVVGMNNAGKSTLLEAISIFAASGDVAFLKKVLELRGVATLFSTDEEHLVEKELEGFLTLYTAMNLDSFHVSPIEFSANHQGSNVTIAIKMVNIAEERDTDNSGEMITRRRIIDNQSADSFGFNILKGLTISVDNAISHMYVFRNTRTGRISLEKQFPCEYVQTAQISSKDNPRYFDNIALSDLEKELIQALNIVDDQIDAINFLKDYKQTLSSREDNRVPMIVYKGSTQRYRLSTMGDGINRILTIILAMLNCKNGVLLVDEFDNGLHYSVQTKLWKMVYRLANTLNVQVFATTHSDDCIKSFIEADKDGDGDGKLIRLENRNGDIVSVPFENKERVEFAINNDIELR